MSESTSQLVRSRYAWFVPDGTSEQPQSLYAVLLQEGSKFDSTDDESDASLALRLGDLLNAKWYRGSLLRPWGVRTRSADAAVRQDIHLEIANSALKLLPDMPVQRISKVYPLFSEPAPSNGWHDHALDARATAMMDWLEDWAAQQ